MKIQPTSNKNNFVLTTRFSKLDQHFLEEHVRLIWCRSDFSLTQYLLPQEVISPRFPTSGHQVELQLRHLQDTKQMLRCTTLNSTM